MHDDGLLQLLSGRRVIVCAGAGGVGKTTVAAALALLGAARGLRVLCLTIDPAKRLADSLGIGHMLAEEQQIGAERFARAGLDVRGSLSVLMLDTKRTFDELVRRYASSPEACQRILENRVYRYVSTGLAGTESYMAMEKVLAVEQDERFDLIVLDTPPTSNALDFLDAPHRLIEAIDSGAMRWLVDTFEKGSRLGLNLVARGVALGLRALGRITGKGFLEHLAEFVSELNELFGGFRERAVRVASAFRGPQFGYVLVATPAPSAIEEARFFAARLLEQGMHTDALVINRVHAEPAPATLPEVQQALTRSGLGLGSNGARRLLEAASEERALARADAAQFRELEREFAEAGLQVASQLRVPALLGDVHDLKSLWRVSRVLGGTG